MYLTTGIYEATRKCKTPNKIEPIFYSLQVKLNLDFNLTATATATSTCIY